MNPYEAFPAQSHSPVLVAAETVIVPSAEFGVQYI